LDLQKKLRSEESFCLADEKASFISSNYIAPELKIERKMTTKADVYAFGIIFWEMIKKENLTSTHFNNEKKRPPTDGLCLSLVNFMEDCWSEDPDKRIDFRQIVERLDEIILEISIEDQRGRDFWKKNFQSSITVPWNQFIQDFALDLGIDWPFKDIFENPESLLPLQPNPSQLSYVANKILREFAIRSVENFQTCVNNVGEKFYTKNDILLCSLKFYLLDQKIMIYI